MSEREIGVVLVAGTRFYREGLSDAIAGRPGLRVLATAADGPSALARIAALSPDVVLVDTAADGMLDLVRTLHAVPVPVPVVALALPERPADVLACAEAGVAGYVPPHASLDDLEGVVRGVLRGELRCSPSVAAALLRRVGALAAGPARPAPTALTTRQREVLALLDQGLSNQQIASRLSIQLATAKNHVHHILELMQVASRAEATAQLRRGARAVQPLREQMRQRAVGTAG